jgi:hypothetical protein
LMTSLYWSSRGTLDDQFVLVIKRDSWWLICTSHQGAILLWIQVRPEWWCAKHAHSNLKRSLDYCVQPNKHVMRKCNVTCDSWNPILKSGVMKSDVKLITSHVATKWGLRGWWGHLEGIASCQAQFFLLGEVCIG